MSGRELCSGCVNYFIQKLFFSSVFPISRGDWTIRMVLRHGVANEREKREERTMLHNLLCTRSNQWSSNVSDPSLPYSHSAFAMTTASQLWKQSLPYKACFAYIWRSTWADLVKTRPFCHVTSLHDYSSPVWQSISAYPQLSE